MICQSEKSVAILRITAAAGNRMAKDKHLYHEFYLKGFSEIHAMKEVICCVTAVAMAGLLLFM